ncbi:MAG: hypothetical protein F9K18_06395 [Thermoanaerobaculia bacterium]|nr:MAG: hypothetical protein F9K18_06395 [Thermoanaerobaculia bacterium]
MSRPFVVAVVACLLSTAAVARAGEPAAPAPAPEANPLAALAPLAGSCFMGTFADGKTRDFICYEWVFGGKFLRSRHRVIGGAGPYSGETLISWDAASGMFAFDYYNSAGGIVRGRFTAVAGGFDFPSEKVQMQGAPAELRSTWRWTERGYHAASEKLTDAGWVPFMAIDFVRSGPASDWTEED